ncbi:hypothetical protein A2311_06735 [candidate division WOR-1 bacterium RIFOXYB2_FULL_48_7]|uniref:Porin domain-containing protein n=1 Tax=candidate division WOR-1 bacterium RIFOXYB2_FULL_48_7 TaxID=1802583 RepID=A0A1F4T9F1_UNCSA|nr:MAG: hypothetical protein A2311_06735 [candidate division WOR-1 bacterium RIFOXYB2_FULL_48_7]
MKNKVVVAIFLLMFLASVAGAAKEVKKAGPAKKPIAKKVVKPVIKEVKPVVAAGVDLSEQLSDMKEETNKALADLKGQLDKVKNDNKDAKVGGVIFFQWQKYLANGTAVNVNNFDVTRAYLDIKKKLDMGAAARLTLDVARITGAARQNLFDYLKYAYVEIPVNVSSVQVVPFDLTAKIGLQQTVWIDWADKILNLRYVAKSLVDNEGVMSSADFGLGALGRLSLQGLPEVDYQATVLNGTGYATNESDSGKALAIRVNSTVYDDQLFGKVTLGAFINIESLNASLNYSASNKQGGAMLALKGDAGVINYEYLTGSKSNKEISGSSLGLVYNLAGLSSLLANLSAFYRADNYDSDTSSAGSSDKQKSFYGLNYDYGKDLRFSANIQTAKAGTAAETKIFYLQSSIGL